jgi:hypothetical protein
MSKLSVWPGRVMHSWLIIQLSQVPGTMQAVRPKQKSRMHRLLRAWQTRLTPAEKPGSKQEPTRTQGIVKESRQAACLVDGELPR